MVQTNRPFRAELQRKQALGDKPSSGGGGVDEGTAQARHAELMNAIHGLREEIAGRSEAPVVSESDARLLEEYKREVHEAATLKHELQELSDAILNTKKEIAKLHPMDRSSDRIAAMTDELDAIVTATESATEAILSASEVIETNTERLRLHSTSEEEEEIVEQVTEQIMNIFEACNFQDLTGQRITRIVNTLRFIEERVTKMIAALGGEEELKEVASAARDEIDTSDSRLLHGPSDGESKISQDEIDNLFD